MVIGERSWYLMVEISTKHSAEEFGPVLATRSVLRVLPLLNTDDRVRDRDRSGFALAVFRALAAAWARAEFPELDDTDIGQVAARNVDGFSPLQRLLQRL